jgi:IMP dehydrogenase
VVGLVTSKDITRREKYPSATRDKNGQLVVGAAVGTKLPEDFERFQALAEAGVDIVVIDIAHGHSSQMVRMIEKLKGASKIPVVAGNVATYEGALHLMEAGADVVKVGIGAGSICTTRVVTGSGVPQLTAIIDSVKAKQLEKFARDQKYIIADGGIHQPGDITKAMAAGADAVMIGSLLAGTTESPGHELVNEKGQRVKIVRGMASRSANISRREVDGKSNIDNIWNKIVPEGVEAIVPYRGEVSEVIYQMVGGLRSGMTYVGAKTLAQLYEKVVFVRITGSGQAESTSHDVSVI